MAILQITPNWPFSYKKCIFSSVWHGHCIENRYLHSNRTNFTIYITWNEARNVSRVLAFPNWNFLISRQEVLFIFNNIESCAVLALRQNKNDSMDQKIGLFCNYRAFHSPIRWCPNWFGQKFCHKKAFHLEPFLSYALGTLGPCQVKKISYGQHWYSKDIRGRP